MQLEEKVRERTRECNAARDVTISAMVNLLEVRSIESSNHTRRTSWMMKLLCSYMRMKPKYEKVLTDDYIQELVSTAPLHDIGKVGIPHNNLMKQGKLTAEEYDLMKMHTVYGVHALEYAIGKNACPSFIKTALQIVGAHHERYDGLGYPNCLKGEDIPLPGRLMSILDVYDAITSERVYKPAYSHEYAIAAIKEGRGTQFDPDITDAFIEIQDDIRNISEWFTRDIV
jgi:putative two-component system response regulator